MSNLCVMDVAFTAAPENIGELHRLHKTLADTIQSDSIVENAFGNGWLGNIAAVHGLDYEKLYCRGEIVSLDDIGMESTSFRVCTETAWCPTPELWQAVCEKYPGVSYVYVAEEPGMGVFINTDRTGEIFPDRIVIDSFCDDLTNPMPPGFFVDGTEPRDVFDGREYFTDFNQLRDYMEGITGNEFSDVKQVESYLATALEAYCGGGGSICIYEFEFE